MRIAVDFLNPEPWPLFSLAFFTDLFTDLDSLIFLL
jgi:hypothetical protein